MRLNLRVFDSDEKEIINACQFRLYSQVTTLCLETTCCSVLGNIRSRDTWYKTSVSKNRSIKIQIPVTTGLLSCSSTTNKFSFLSMHNSLAHRDWRKNLKDDFTSLSQVRICRYKRLMHEICLIPPKLYLLTSSIACRLLCLAHNG